MHRRPFLHALGYTALTTLYCPLASRAAEAIVGADGNWQSTLLREHPLAGKIWHAATERFVSPDFLFEKLGGAHFRLLGEVHDNPDSHALQGKMLESLGAKGIKPVVAFEQFDHEHDAALRLRQTQGKMNAGEVADTVQFNRKGWNWDFYRPLIEIALRHDMPLRAANLSRAAAGLIAKQGLPALAHGQLAALQRAGTWSSARESALRDIIFDGHCRALSETAMPNMMAAQRARDATLAEALQNTGRDGAVLIAGNGHVRRDLAVPIYLNAAGSGEICAVGTIEVAAVTENPWDYLKTAITGSAPYDFVYFVPRAERPDPCAAFSPRGGA